MAAQTELTIITKAKDLCRYILTVTEKSPKRFRFTLVSRMQNLALDTIEHAYRANEVFMKGPDVMAARNQRLSLQHKALTSLRLLGFLSQMAREQGCILPNQYEQISRMSAECQYLLGGWINSDRKRWGNAQ